MIHVLQTGNQKIYRGICLNVLSILKYTKEPVHLHIMTIEIPWSNVPKISLEEALELKKVMQEVNPLNDVSYYDVSKDFIDTFKDTPNMQPKYTPASLIRLLLTRYINCDKLIYLDADIMTCRSLEELWNIDISNYEMGVSLDYLGKFWQKKDYFNSGMLYINMKMVKETKLFEKAISLLQKEKFFFADQTALYKCSTKRLYLPFKFNEQRKIKEDTVIKHFNKGIRYLPYFKIYNYKQWDVYHMHKYFKEHFFDDIYEEYKVKFPNAEPLIYEKK